MDDTLIVKRHIKYFKHCLNVLPGRFTSLDTNRMTIAFFSLAGLDLLDALSDENVNKAEAIDWIYSLQVLPVDRDGLLDMTACGFRGSTMNGADNSSADRPDILYDSGHVAMTYTALCSLLALGDDLSRLDRQAVLYGLKNLQLPDGSFQFCVEGSENDMRFLYCVASICYILNDFSQIDVDGCVDFIKRSLTYEGAFAQGPFLEAHGGSTFCAVASLWMFDRLDALSPSEIEGVKRWCVTRQETGFQGRPNKPADTCYSFWVGGTLCLLDAATFINSEANRSFLLSAQDCITGGFSKWPSHTPDPMHAYMALGGLTLINEPGLQELFPALNLSTRAVSHLRRVQEQW